MNKCTKTLRSKDSAQLLFKKKKNFIIDSIRINVKLIHFITKLEKNLSWT